MNQMQRGARKYFGSGAFIVALGFFVAVSMVTFSRTQSGESIEEARAGANRSVLGASSTRESSPCPESKPTIGWIDLDGKKRVVYSLEKDQKASVCFVDEKAANAEGYFRN
jgi:hypothetical protein